MRGARDLLADAVREAGALALQTFRGELKSWTKGKSSPVSEADIAVDALLRERLLAAARFRLALGGDRGRSGAPAAAARLDGRSDRRHPRLSRRPARMGDFRRAGRATAVRWSAALYAPVDRRIVPVGRGRRRDAQRRADQGERAAITWRARRFAGPKRRLDVLAAIEPGIETGAAHSLARPAARARRDRRARRHLHRLPTATIGTLRRLIFWCTKPAAR